MMDQNNSQRIITPVFGFKTVENNEALYATGTSMLTSRGKTRWKYQVTAIMWLFIILFSFLTDVARFDNSHSWTKAKKLSYWLELLEPSDVEPEFQEMVEGADSMNLND